MSAIYSLDKPAQEVDSEINSHQRYFNKIIMSVASIGKFDFYRPPPTTNT
jgi:hypothetical protein